jgi:hypothetical protein
MITILTGVRWDLNVVLICITLRAEVEHFFMYLLAICNSYFEKYLFSSLAHLLIRIFIPLVLIFCSFHIFWLLIPYWMNSWKDFFLTC